MRVMLLHKLAEHIPENYVRPQKLIADVGKMVSDARDAGLLRDGAGLRSIRYAAGRGRGYRSAPHSLGWVRVCATPYFPSIIMLPSMSLSEP